MNILGNILAWEIYMMESFVHVCDTTSVVGRQKFISTLN